MWAKVGDEQNQNRRRGACLEVGGDQDRYALLILVLCMHILCLREL